MKNRFVTHALRMGLCLFVSLLFVSKSFASDADMYLEITDAGGKITKVPIEKDGSFTVPLPAGRYEWQLVSRPQGSNAQLNSARSVSVSYHMASREASSGMTSGRSTASPRDVHSGATTGKRMHKPFVITKEWGSTTRMVQLDPLVIDSSCDASGKIVFKDEKGKTMAMDDWATPSTK